MDPDALAGAADRLASGEPPEIKGSGTGHHSREGSPPTPVLTGALWTPAVLQGPQCPNCRVGGTTPAHRPSREGPETREEDRHKSAEVRTPGPRQEPSALPRATGDLAPSSLSACFSAHMSRGLHRLPGPSRPAALCSHLLPPSLVPTHPCHPLCCHMSGCSCLDPCMGQALGGVPPSLLLVQLQGHLHQEASAPRPICQSLGEHDFPLPSASATPHASASRLPDGCTGHAAQAPLSAPLQRPRRPARWQRGRVCPARQLTSPGTSGSAPAHLSTVSRNRMKHALGTLEPSPHLGLWV